MYLMHKNKFVAKLITYQGVIIGVSEVYNEKLLPIGMQGSVKFADWKILTWLTNRIIPRTRINIEEIEDEKTVWEYLKDNHGLSMNDCIGSRMCTQKKYYLGMISISEITVT